MLLRVQISPWPCPVAHHSLSAQLFSLLPLIGCLSTLSALEEGGRSHSRHPWDDLSPREVSSWSEGRLLVKALALVQQHNLVPHLRYVFVIHLVCKSQQCLFAMTSGDRAFPNPAQCRMKRGRNESWK